jgi:hypothetical protein
MIAPKILFSTHSSPAYIPPLVLSERQIIIGPEYAYRCDAIGRTESLNCTREFDVAEIINNLPQDEHPDIFVALVDSFMGCLPRNLGSLNCRKVLVIADTHHGPSPLTQLLLYSRAENYDRIAVTHDPHHLHWFAEAGLAPVSLQLNLNVHDPKIEFSTERRPYIQFIGQVGRFHPRRLSLLNHMASAGLPVMRASVPANIAAVQYSRAQLSFNCSLNGDYNMRIFEVLAAGGCLLTDRLSVASGLETMFKDGHDLIIYDNAQDLLDKARFYLANPALCLRIAAQGQMQYRALASESSRRRRFLDFAIGDDVVARRMAEHDQHQDPRSLRRSTVSMFEQRLGAYQFLQDLQRTQSINQVELSPGLNPAFVEDISDLIHLHIVKKAQDGSLACGLLDERELSRRLDPCSIAPLKYLLVLNARGDLPVCNESVKRLGYKAEEKALTGQNYTWLLKAG